VVPLSPPLKSGPTTSSNLSVNPSSVVTHSLQLVPVFPLSSDTALVPKKPYKVIPPNPAYEDKQRYQCANCHSDTQLVIITYNVIKFVNLKTVCQ